MCFDGYNNRVSVFIHLFCIWREKSDNVFKINVWIDPISLKKKTGIKNTPSSPQCGPIILRALGLIRLYIIFFFLHPVLFQFDFVITIYRIIYITETTHLVFFFLYRIFSMLFILFVGIYIPPSFAKAFGIEICDILLNKNTDLFFFCWFFI